MAPSSPISRSWKVFLVIILLFLAPASPVAQSLDLTKYRLVFDEDFSDPNISAHGPGTRWIAHTPWFGDFGEAQFVDPRPRFPFDRVDGVFRIEMRKMPNGRWESGLMASVDHTGKGFAQQYGVFEIRTKLPAGPGVWPAFWLSSFVPLPPDPSVEIDVFEHYGKFPGAFNSTVTVWPKVDQSKKASQMHIREVLPGSLSNEFHTYSVEVTPEWIMFYFDRVEYWRARTPPDHKHPLMILVDLALGGGWPTDSTPSPVYMYIDYIRAYAPLNLQN